MGKLKRGGALLVYGIIILIAAVSIISVKLFFSDNELKPERDYAVIANDTLRIVTDLYPVENFENVVGSVSEFHYDLAELVGKESGLDYVIIIENSLTKSFDGLENGDYDIIARPIIVSDLSKERFLLSDGLNADKQVVVQRKSRYNDGIPVIESVMDLAGKEVHIPDDETVQMILENLSMETGDSIYVCMEMDCGVEQIVTMVADGEIDFAVCDYTTAKKMAKYLKQIDIRLPVSFEMQQSWGVRKESPVLRDSLDVWMERVKNSRNFRRLLNKYGLR